MNVEFLEAPIGPQKKTSEYLAEKKKESVCKNAGTISQHRRELPIRNIYSRSS